MDQVERIELRTNPRWLRVCDIKRPRTALEVKFSYGLLAAMALTGIDTGADRTYVDALCSDPALVDVAGRVSVEGDASVGDLAAEVTVILRNGEPIRVAHDLAAPMPVDVLARGLRAKAEALLGPDRAERMWAATRVLETRSAGDLGALLRG